MERQADLDLARRTKMPAIRKRLAPIVAPIPWAEANLCRVPLTVSAHGHKACSVARVANQAKKEGAIRTVTTSPIAAPARRKISNFFTVAIAPLPEAC